MRFFIAQLRWTPPNKAYKTVVMKHINGFFGAITLEKAEQIPRGRGTFNPIFRAYIDWGPYPLLKGYLVTQQGARFPAAFFPL